MAIHSQDMNIPECPNGWRGLWIGYSFAMVSMDSSFFGFQNLSALAQFPLTSYYEDLNKNKNPINLCYYKEAIMVNSENYTNG